MIINIITLITGTDHRQAWANSVDPDQMPQDVAFDLGLHCLQPIQQVLDISIGSQMDLFNPL